MSNRERVLQAGFLDGVGTGAVTTLMSVFVTQRWGLDTLGLVMASGLVGRGFTVLWGWYAQKTETHTNRDHYVLTVSVMVLASVIVCAILENATTLQLCVGWAFFVGLNSVSTIQLTLRIMRDGSKLWGSSILGSGFSALLVGVSYTSMGYKWSQALAITMCLVQALQLLLTRGINGDRKETTPNASSTKTRAWWFYGFALSFSMYGPVLMQAGLISRWHDPGWSGPAVLIYAVVPLCLKLQNRRTDARYTSSMVFLHAFSTVLIPLNPLIAVATRLTAAYSLFSLQNQTQLRAADVSGAGGVSSFMLGIMIGGVSGAWWFGYVTEKLGIVTACIIMTVTGVSYALLVRSERV
jgi:hypothetical protein